MFTGIIEEIGQIKHIAFGTKSSRLIISADKVLDDVKTGDSICTNGVCLTVSRYGSDYFEADVMAETMRRTNFRELKSGDKVNLERAMQLNGRFGGHIVSGHVDGTGVIVSMKKEENAVWVSIGTNENILKYIVEKGSITIDGISLTVTYVDDHIFKVSIIPHTGAQTTLLGKKIGDSVNLENDLIGKYVEKMLKSRMQSAGVRSSVIDEDYLRKYGFCS